MYIYIVGEKVHVQDREVEVVGEVRKSPSKIVINELSAKRTEEIIQ